MLRMLKQADRSAILTLSGTILVKFAAGIMGIWGSTNIYFFSYLRNNGTIITPFTNSIILLCTIVPSVFAMLVSTTLTKMFGYKSVIRISGLVFALVPCIINLKLNLFILGFCYLLIPISCLSISSVAIINCLWSQYSKHLNKVTGIAVLSFSLGSIVFNLLFATFTNPNNQPAIIDQQQQAYFAPNVSNNIFKASNINFLISGVAYMIGSFLINKKEIDDSQSSINIQLPEQSPNQVQSETKTEKKDKQAFKNDMNTIKNEEKKQPENNKIDEKKQVKKIRLRDSIGDKKFFILLWISYLTPLYIIYLSVYMKLIFMPVLNDDHYLVFCAIVVTVAGIIAAPIWGYVGDQKGFKTTLLIIITSDLVAKIFGLFCTQKWNIVLMYLLLSFNDSGLVTIIGPGLVDMFGLQMATQLIPYKGISVCMAQMTVPIFQIMMPDYSEYRVLLGMFICLSLIAFALAVYFYRNIQYSKHQQKGARRPSKQILQQNIQGHFP